MKSTRTSRHISAEPRQYVGVNMLAVESVRVSNNDVAGVGPGRENGPTNAGIRVVSFRDAIINSNQVQQEGESSSQLDDEPWTALLVDSVNERRRRSRSGSFSVVRVDERRTLVLGAARPFVMTGVNSIAIADDGDADTGVRAVHGVSVSVSNNLLTAKGGTPIVKVTTSGNCTFSNNRCELQRRGGSEAVHLDADTAIISANRVRGGIVSIKLVVDKKRMTVLGNITSNGITPDLDPWSALNVLAT